MNRNLLTPHHTTGQDSEQIVYVLMHLLSILYSSRQSRRLYCWIVRYMVLGRVYSCRILLTYGWLQGQR